jgi:hypothetical protein
MKAYTARLLNPVLSSSRELRFGTKGSVSVQVEGRGAGHAASLLPHVRSLLVTRHAAL